MIRSKDYKISMLDLVLGLSSVMDLMNPAIMGHHKRTAYIACCLGRELDLPEEEMSDLVFATALHDIGAFSEKQRIDVLSFEDHNHSFIAYQLLEKFEPFSTISKIIRFHHMPWMKGQGTHWNNEEVPFLSHIVHLADRVDAQIRSGKFILDQRKQIQNNIDKFTPEYFHPDINEAFLAISQIDAFWFDIISPYLDQIIKQALIDRELLMNIYELTPMAKMFCQVIDFRSRFTSTHSSGVAFVSTQLGELLGFPKKECQKLTIAGYLHDIGKIGIPKEILEKQSSLNSSEYNKMKMHPYYTFHIINIMQGLDEIRDWAAFHHERLDGKGYPFCHQMKEQDIGARIMAVADVYTALAEERPYRGSLPFKRSIELMNDLVEKNMLDKNIVELLADNINDIHDGLVHSQSQAQDSYNSFLDIPINSTPESQHGIIE